MAAKFQPLTDPRPLRAQFVAIKPFSLKPRPLLPRPASQMGICVCCVRARHTEASHVSHVTEASHVSLVSEASLWRPVKAPSRGRRRAFDAIDPDEVFDRRALLEEDRQCYSLHRQAKRDAKRQQQRLKKGPLKSIPEQGDADGEEAGGDVW